MLHKLTIALCALFLISACGSQSLDLGPSGPPSVTPPPAENGNGNGNDIITHEFDLTDNWYTKEAWNIEDDVPPEMEHTAEGVIYFPVNPNQQLVTEFDGPVDLRNATVTFVVSVNEDYLASEANAVQPFQQKFIRNEEEDDDEVGGNWGCWTGVGEWTADTEMEISCNATDDSELFELGEGEYLLFGIQSQGPDATSFVTGTIRIHSLVMEYGGSDENGNGNGNGNGGGVLEVDMTSDGSWRVNPDTLDMGFNGGVYYEPIAEDDQLVFDISGPIDLNNAVITIEMEADADFLASGANVQPFLQQIEGNWTGHWDCWVNNEDINAGPHVCEINDVGDDFNLFDDTEQAQIGVQAKGSPEGRLTITSVTIEYQGEAVSDGPMVLDTASGWRANPDDLPMEQSEDGVYYEPTAEDDQLVYDLSGPLDLNNAVVTIEMEADADFLASGANVQPFLQQIEGNWTGHWDCWVNNEDINAGPHVCEINDVGDDFNLFDDTEQAQVGVQVKGSPEGRLTILSVTIELQ